MKFPRASGILLHPTSLPGRFGIGSVGAEAYRFVDFLVSAGQRLWQMLPLGPTGYGNSPYQCLSAFAGNPLLISLERLAEEKLLESTDLEGAPSFPEHRVDYDMVTELKIPLLKRSFGLFERKISQTQRDMFESFCAENASWLDDYALFMAMRDAHNLAPWNTWEEDIRRRQPMALERWGKKLAQEVRCYKYLQFQFFRQLSELKRYCNDRGVRLMGDIAHFVALDSAEVWSHQEMFYLDANGKPTVVAGVPPDYFSKKGQLWGNPIYRWEEMAKDGYAWWIERLRATLKVVDIIRLDHFRGCEKYWKVPAKETTAVNGRWVPGPGAKLFEAVRKALGDIPLIAEDLGVITPEVGALRERFGFPGMRVLQFAFGSDGKANDHQPHHYPRNCVVYTGTHDNNTTIGWFSGGTEDTSRGRGEVERERQLALKYLGTTGKEINWDFIRLALASVADIAIIPLQDVLGLGSEARMNLPATTKGNWEWRFTFHMLTDEIKNRLGELTELYGR